MFPRSAIKAIQALPLVESGAADRYGFGLDELALACSSHSGEPGHVATAERMLQRIGLDASALKCGAHWPIHQPSAHALARAGGHATAVHNNCSGKHAGFLCVACATGADVAHYVQPAHPVQRAVKDTLETLSEAPLTADLCAVDGCSVPTWALPLDALALGVCAVRQRRAHAAAARAGRGAAARGLRGASVARRRHRAVLHRGHGAASARGSS